MMPLLAPEQERAFSPAIFFLTLPARVAFLFDSPHWHPHRRTTLIACNKLAINQLLIESKVRGFDHNNEGF
jgi:hypothetical protein